jgi:Tol biopolymer transport system component
LVREEGVLEMEGRARLATLATASLLLVAPLGLSRASASGLPDGRAYELVSPAVKNGADVTADSGRTRAAANGGAASFTSLGGFGDVRGTGIATEYLATRSGASAPGSSGWSSHAITPLQKPLTFFGAVFSLDPLWEGEFSDDLTAGVFRAWSPLTDEDPSVADVENLYRRDNLRTAGAGSYHLATPCPACGGSPLPPFDVLQFPEFLAASADFNHVLFASSLPLTSDATASASNVYEWTPGGLRLAGVLPDSACGSPPCPAPGSTATRSRSISADGTRIIFTSAGQIYERIDGSSTVPVSASERTEPDPNGTQSASYQTASSDGTRVFFISGEQLTDDDTDTVSDLYMWDATKPDGQRLTRLTVDDNPEDAQNGVNGVIGASTDGRYVYFVANGQLVAGQPMPGNPLIYVWHDERTPTIAYIGEMALPSADEAANFVNGGTLDGGGEARVTPNGKHLLFASHSGQGLLSAHGGSDYDQTTHCAGGCGELYVYSADTNELACVSCDPTGVPATTEARDVVRDGTGASSDATHRNHPLTADGQRVFFHTTESLLPADSNGRSDVYEYDVVTHSLHLISTGTSPADSFFLDASSDGRDLFFLTRQRLVGWDIDQNYDVYDARVDGGFPDPMPASGPCTGEVCKGLAAASPGVTESATRSFHGAGNVRLSAKKKVRKCKRGFVRKKLHGKLKCVRKRRKAGKANQVEAQRRTR